MNAERPLPRHLAALAAYLALALAYTWPLIGHFTTLFFSNGDITTGCWNIWHFRHSVLAGTNPFWTDYQYWPYGNNLILHHYTLFYDVLGFFLLPSFGMTATYNLICLSTLVLAGYGVFLICRLWGAGWGSSFIAGGLFAFGPGNTQVQEAISCLDYSCTHVLPFFLLTFTRAVKSGKARDAALAALCLTWVNWSNYYYFMFCVLFVVFIFFWRERPLTVGASRRKWEAWSNIAGGLLAAGLLCALAWLILALRAGQKQFHGHGSPGELLHYVAPYLSFWAALFLGFWFLFKIDWRFHPGVISKGAWKPYALVMSLWTFLNLPLLVSVAFFYKTGDMAAPLSPWRGGGNPTELAWMFLPSYYHPLWGDWVRRLGSHLNLGYSAADTGSASLGLIALAAALWLRRQRPQDPDVKLWFAGLIFSFVMTLGPWLKIFGVETYLPLPFYFAHLLPFFNGMQTGMRFHIFASLFLCLILAAALERLRSLIPPRWAAWLCPIVFMLLVFESLPRINMISLKVSPLIHRLKERPEGAVLRIPTGAVFNGLGANASFGELFDPIYQTIHEKPIVGGYLTRSSRHAYDAMIRDPFIQALVAAQGGGPVAALLNDPVLPPRYLRDTRIRYVLLETAVLPESLLRVLARWPLKLIDQQGSEKLYAVDIKRP